MLCFEGCFELTGSKGICELLSLLSAIVVIFHNHLFWNYWTKWNKPCWNVPLIDLVRIDDFGVVPNFKMATRAKMQYDLLSFGALFFKSLWFKIYYGKWTWNGFLQYLIFVLTRNLIWPPQRTNVSIKTPEKTNKRP